MRSVEFKYMNLKKAYLRLKEVPVKKVAVAVAQDEPVLEAIKKDELPGPSTSEPATSTVDDDLPF